MAAKKSALGKGLSSLLPQLDGPAQGQRMADDGFPVGPPQPRTRLYNFEERARLAGRVAEVDVDTVRPNPYQPRTEFDETALAELAASIEQLGIIQPITVRVLGTGQFELISGERRLRAARRAGLKRVPAYVREADTEAMLEMAIVENIQRENLNPIEVALGYRRLMEEVGLTQEQVADKMGKSRTTVTNQLRLLKLPPRIQAAIRDGSITAGHARMLISLDDPDFQSGLLREIIDEELSVRDVERRVREHRQHKEDAETPQQQDDADAKPAVSQRDQLQVHAFETKLRDHLSTHVKIQHKPDHSGKVEIAYYSAEDLERVLDRVLGR